MAQLAEMGVSVPDEHRGEVALAGGWQVVSQRAIEPDDQALKEPSLSVGVRKRKFEGQEEEEEAGEAIMKKGWGSTTKEYPSDTKQGLEALLASSIPVKKEALIKKEDLEHPATYDHVCCNTEDKNDTLVASDSVQVKQEIPGLLASPNGVSDQPEDTPKTTSEAPAIVFKKRKSKNPRER
jgi:nitrogen fixation protein